jgi:tetratricopeptide (TPR) repeat protein
MSDSTKPHLDRIDRYVRNELTPDEARELAQKSLDEPELFEDLTFSAVAKAALSARSVGERLEQPASGAKVVPFPLKARVLVTSAAAAAAIVLVSLYSLRSSFLWQNRSTPAQNQQSEKAPVPRPAPALAFSAKPGQPILLASDLQPDPARREGAPVFRSPEPDSRSPQPSGSIISIEDRLATINLGSLDGLAKGTELQVFGDERFTQPIGRLIVTTVFRERARGRILDGQAIQANHRVRAPAAVYLGALLQQLDARSGRGDSDAARTMAEKAVEWAQAANVPPGEKRKALERLATLEHQAGSLQAAENHYQLAVDSLHAEPPASVQEQSVAFNNLAVLRLLRGDYEGAEAPLSQAVSKSLKTDSTYGRSVNNLAVLAELRGDRRKAETLYNDALRAFASIPDSTPQERGAVERNLARLRSSR